MSPPLLRDDSTICAVATGTGGGIGIVRISGTRAEAIVARLVPSLAVGVESHRLCFGTVRDPESGEVLDEALVCVMRGARSFTGETVGELHVHGGAVNLGRVLDAVVRCGARVAEPGEFTRRAFLAGRIDLTRAEAVAEVIAARSERALRVAQAQLRGALFSEVEALRDRVVALLADVEARVDFPDEPLDFVPLSSTAGALRVVAGEIASLSSSYARGRVLAGGIDVALVGRPNAGKSSLLNALVGEERALVDELPGTTRDFVEVETVSDGVRMVLVDTAGEREGAAPLEQRGLELGRKRRARADVVVVVVDGEMGLGSVEASLLDEHRGQGRVLAWNKCDLRMPSVSAPVGDGALRSEVEEVATSARERLGLDELRAAIRRAAGDVGEDGAATVTSARQKEALDEAERALRNAVAIFERGEPPELGAVDLREALERLGRVTGVSVDEAVLDAVFARFCIGK